MNKRIEFFSLLLIDFLTIGIAWLVYYIIRVESGLLTYAVRPAFWLPALAIYLYWFIVFFTVGMYRTWSSTSRFDELTTLFKASFVGIFILFFLIFMDDASTNDPASKSRYLIFIYWFLFLAFTGAGRLIIRSVQRGLIIRGVGRRNAIIVGFNQKANNLHDQILEHRGLGLDIAGYIAVQQENMGKEYRGTSVIDTTDNIGEVIDRLNIKEIIISTEKQQEDVIMDIIARCDNKNVSIKILADLYEIISGGARMHPLYGFPLIDVMPQLMPEWERKAKRILDIIVAIVLLVLSSPITILTAIAIKLDSRGPVLYKQERSGLNGRPFYILKFRSMRQDAEVATGPVWSQKNDPRITKVGAFIRKVRIDEIPQMINVLKGEMSLVGPRPERPFFVEQLAEQIPLYKKRLKVRPGITGWAQVKHKYDESIEDVKTKLRYDLYYIENMSIRMDLRILFRTIFVVLFGKGHFE